MRTEVGTYYKRKLVKTQTSPQSRWSLEMQAWVTHAVDEQGCADAKRRIRLVSKH